ncbi:MAG: NAD-dependent epimerase/dehydratase family protein [Candidatus Magasanikbacteria bacterium]|nr:NAD-dependent epimerase/dehydratase family protein [Candidatus Magasanikbacteria bacterium]MBT4221478.1 NAD-dependent epimerase/dehydratase family protein [Candidatus Magasanikbacteria bacterium]MBT4350674.1 NAD-dependent epimerase/dehydratase family protein [Candidatus Magasanikbacteria bacterium]MBT4541650.1 NAD-dependent epimerase/dehydratase family protein [Candidatus Magasanikbacteria bacterium]MBT6252907.1 NAD-dependent epimerase/dehydratase family protein [Candidatus Magasanikbacteria
MARALVTGGAGFIGSHLTDHLISLGHDVIVLDNLLLGKREFVNEKATFHEGDIRDLPLLKELCKGVDVVFHLAADPRLPISIEDPSETHDVNVTGTLNVFIAAKDAGVKKVVFTSTCAVYGDQELPIREDMVPVPKSPYGLHKLMGEQYAQLFHELYGLSTVSLRYFNVYGPRKTAEGGYPMVIPIFLAQRQRNEAMTIVGDGEQTRDYVHVSDVVRANILAWESDVVDGQPCNIGSGEQVSVNAISQFISGESVHIPERQGEMRFIESDSTRAKDLLSWEPTMPFLEGLASLKQEWLGE